MTDIESKQKPLIRLMPLMASTLMMSSALYMPQSVANDSTTAHWSQWKAMGSGYVARRREPARPDQVNLRRAQSKAYAQRASKKPKVPPEVPPSWNVLVPALWLQTQGEGLYEVSIEELAAQLGMNPSSVRKRASRGALQLTTAESQNSWRAKQPVAWYYDADNDSVLFAAQDYDTFYTDQNAYRFKLTGRNSRLAKPMVVAQAGSAIVGVAQEAFQDTLKFEEEPDFYYSTWTVASEPDADYWFWDYLYGGSKDSIEVNLDIPTPAPNGEAQLRVTLRGWTDLVEGDDHEVYAELNGQPIGSSVVWDGFEQAVLTADFDQSILDPSGNNQLVLRNRYEPGATPGEWLDQIEIDYARRPVAQAGMLSMHGVDAGIQTVEGFSSNDILVVEAPAGDAVLRQDLQVQPDGQGGWSVTFAAQQGLDYLVAERSAINMPVIVADSRANLKNKNNRANYLIIAPQALTQTATALASLREERFNAVKVVWLEDIYREFSAGRVDPAALGRFMKKAMKSWKTTPSYVVLVGKGTLDEKDRMGYADSFLPVRLFSTPWSLAASDSKLLGYETGAPFAIGRLPITDDMEGLAYVDKLASYEATTPGDEVFRAVLIADNPDDAGDFHGNSDLLAGHLQSDLNFTQVTKLYHPTDDVRTDLIDSNTWETGYVSYDGHGSAAQVGDYREKFITAADAAALQNPHYPMFTALTCAAGDDTLPGTQSLSAALVLNPNGGAIASFAPTGLSLDADAQVLGTAYVDALYLDDASIGEAVRQAKLDTAESISAFMSPMYSVVGDPAVNAR